MLPETLMYLERFLDLAVLQSEVPDTVSRPVVIGKALHTFPLDNIHVETEIMYGDDNREVVDVSGVEIETISNLREYWPTADHYSFPAGEIVAEYTRRIDRVHAAYRTSQKLCVSKEESDVLVEELEVLRDERQELIGNVYTPRLLNVSEQSDVRKALIALEVKMSGTTMLDLFPSVVTGSTRDLLWLLILFKELRLVSEPYTPRPVFDNINRLMVSSGFTVFQTIYDLVDFFRGLHFRVEVIMQLLKLHADIFSEIEYVQRVYDARKRRAGDD